MNMKDQETLNALLKKLSAVRVTLSDEEQGLLDWLIQGPRPEFIPEEVKAQSFKYQAAPIEQMSPDETRAMSLKMKPEASAEMGPDETRAMSAKFQPEQVKVGIIVIYDPELEAYRYY